MSGTILAASVKQWLDDWAPAAEWAVAIATAALALMTYLLARGAKQEANKVGEQVALQAEAMAAAQRPVVYPITPHDWLERFGERGS